MNRLLFFALIFGLTSNAQTTLFSENFETGGTSFTLNTSDSGGATSGSNLWVVNNAYAGGNGSLICLGFPFNYSIQSTPNQPGGITASPNSSYLHILSQEALNDNIHSSSYMSADGICFLPESNFSKMAAAISTTGYTNVSIDFWWLCAGSANAFGELYYSIDGGNTWVLNNTNFNNQSSWVQTSISNPVWDNQADLRFAFRFVNNTASTAADPVFSIDDIIVLGETPLGNHDFNKQSNTINLSPNPSHDFIKISGLKQIENYTIYNVLGMETHKGTISNNEKIDIQNLTNGFYFIKFKNKRIIKFIKK